MHTRSDALIIILWGQLVIFSCEMLFSSCSLLATAMRALWSWSSSIGIANLYSIFSLWFDWYEGMLMYVWTLVAHDPFESCTPTQMSLIFILWNQLIIFSWDVVFSCCSLLATAMKAHRIWSSVIWYCLSILSLPLAWLIRGHANACKDFSRLSIRIIHTHSDVPDIHTLKSVDYLQLRCCLLLLFASCDSYESSSNLIECSMYGLQLPKAHHVFRSTFLW